LRHRTGKPNLKNSADVLENYWAGLYRLLIPLFFSTKLLPPFFWIFYKIAWELFWILLCWKGVKTGIMPSKSGMIYKNAYPGLFWFSFIVFSIPGIFIFINLIRSFY